MTYKIGLIIGGVVVFIALLGGIYFSTNPRVGQNDEASAVSEITIMPDCANANAVAPTESVPNPLSACDLPVFKVPGGWTKKELVNPLAINIQLSSPEKNLYGAPDATINVFVMAERADFTLESESNSQMRENEAYKRIPKENNRDIFTNFSKQQVTISGTTGYQVEVDNVLLQENPYHIKTIYLAKDGNVYSFSASAPKEKWSMYETVIDAAFASIKL